jgi:hypothetical protein
LFPSVEKLTVRLTFLSPRGEPAGEESRQFGANDPIDLTAACPGSCGVGTFDLQTKVAAVLAAAEPASEASGKCQTPRYGSNSEPCGYELRCKIDAVYAPKPEPKPEPEAKPEPAPSNTGA